MTTRDGIKAQDQYINDLTGALKKDLDSVFQQVLVRVAGQMQRQIDFAAGPTTVNRRELRKIATQIDKMSKAMGVPKILDEFAAGFEGTLPYFDQILSSMGQSMKSPLVAKLTEKDLLVLEGIKEGSKQSVEAALDVMIAQAKRNMLLRVAALDFEDTVESIRKTFGRGVAEAETLAATGLTMYTRTNAEQNFKRIEKEFLGEDFRYRFEGPDDKLTRPFCDHLLDRTKKTGLTRAEIDKLDNGQLPNVFVTGGGYNCRHQWILDIRQAKAVTPAARTAEQAREELSRVADSVDSRLKDIRAELLRLNPDDLLGRGKDLRDEELALIDSRLKRLREVIYSPKKAKFTENINFGSANPDHKRRIQEGIEAFRRLIGPGVIDGNKIDVQFSHGIRAGYSLVRKSISIGSAVESNEIMVHELGHWLEDLVDGVHQAAVEFLKRRTTSKGKREAKVSLRKIYGSGSGYQSDEVVRRDKFKNPYTGKAYEAVRGDGTIDVYATEIISMGLEAIYSDPLGFAKEDPDFFDFVYALIRKP
jgi:hypothetical protein